jgi:hypothetical protein
MAADAARWPPRRCCPELGHISALRGLVALERVAEVGGPGGGGLSGWWSGGEREANLAVMSEMTQEEALRLADALVGQALKETEARCAVLGQFINDCEHKGSRTSAWSEALRELRALHGCRTGLMRRHSLIQEALDCPVGECPAKVPLPPPPDRTVLRVQQQVQVQARRRSSSWG